jgi:hypothetical protein
MRIVRPEDSFIEIENVPYLKFKKHELTGFKCAVLNAAIYNNKREVVEKVEYSNCVMTVSRNIISVKNNDSYIWKINTKFISIDESGPTARLDFIKKYDERIGIRVKNHFAFVFFYLENNMPTVCFQIKGEKFIKDVFDYFN